MIGWKRAVRPTLSASPTSFVSVIVPFRNEAATIAYLLKDLAAQHYAAFEIILVNDHSEDDSLEVISSVSEKSPQLKERIKLLHCTTSSGKKAALTLGIAQATGYIIMTTDADCRIGKDWIEDTLKHFTHSTVMVLGGVRFSATNFFEKMQQLEFASLIGSGAATLAWLLPSMANGANLAFTKMAFQEVGGYTGNEHIPSGDDEFLVRKMHQRFPHAICFNTSKVSVVETAPARTCHHFLQQRLRWAGKWSLHRGWFSKLLPISIFIFQLVFLLTPWLILLGILSWRLGALLLISKALLEFSFFLPILRQLGISFSGPAFLSLQFIYPYYVVAVGLLANGRKYTWKGRTF